MLGRCHLDDPFVSRCHALIEPLLSSPPSLHLTVKGANSIIVETMLGGSLVVKGMLEKGASMLLNEGDSFYVVARKETTTVSVIIERDASEAGPPHKKRRVHGRVEPQGAYSQNPSPFSLMSIIRPDKTDGATGVSLSDLCPSTLPPNVSLGLLIISNYQIDLTYLNQNHCPALFNADHVVILHGGRNGGNDSERMRDECMLLGLDLNKITIHAPLVQNYGTHHSKFVILFLNDNEGCRLGMRLIITSANFIQADLEAKTQSIWWQDFPALPPDHGSSGQLDGFGKDLSQYLSCTGVDKALIDPALDLHRMIISHDFSSSRAHLIPSAPGWHIDYNSWGHMKLRRLLQSLPPPSGQGRIVLQYTSIGKTDENWLFNEFGSSLGGSQPSSSIRSGSTSRPLIKIIWPTYVQVRDSHRGWAAGSSIPGSSENINRPFLLPLYAKWDGHDVGRSDVMPHMKSYACFDPDGHVNWVVTGSHNLSKVAWGHLSKENKLGIQSYELSVLLLPELEEKYLTHQHFGYQVVPLRGQALKAFTALKESKEAARTSPPNGPLKVEFWPLSALQQTSQASDVERGTVKYYPPLPYDSSPEPYKRGDQPWCRETEWEGYDSIGLTIQEAMYR